MGKTMKPYEEVLRSLEKSKPGAVLDIDQIATFAGLTFDASILQYVVRQESILKSKTSSLRSQWILRTLLKRIQEEILSGNSQQAVQSHASVVRDAKLWPFLLFLISVIPSDKTVTILQEYSFAQVLLRVGTPLVSAKPAQALVGNATHQLCERPPKRQKTAASLVNTPEMLSNQENDPVIQLEVFMRIFLRYGSVLRDMGKEMPTKSRSTVPAWTSSSDEAAQLLSIVLDCAALLLQNARTTGLLCLVNDVELLWLDLWHTYAAVTKGDRQDTAQKSFSEYCLCSALANLERKTTLQHETCIQPSFLALERAVATYTLLPLRTEFNKIHRTVWEKNEDNIEWDMIEPVYDMFQSFLGSSLESSVVAGIVYASLPDPVYASCLIRIAVRLIPKADQRRFQREHLWHTALAICLAYLVSPTGMPRLRKTPDSSYENISAPLPQSEADMLPDWPIGIFTPLIDSSLTLSISMTAYIVTTMLLWQGPRLHVSSVCQIVGLNIDAFVPGTAYVHGIRLLEQLFSMLDERDRISMSELKELVQGVLLPVLQAFAKVRALKDFVKLWQPRLEDAIRVQHLSSPDDDMINVVHIWADEDLVEEFGQLVRASPSGRLLETLLEDLLGLLRSAANRIGSTTDIFASLVLFQAAAHTDKRTVPGQPNNARNEELLKAVSECLDVNTDYQGQRWRLWMLLDTMLHDDLPKSSQIIITEAVANSPMAKQSKAFTQPLSRGAESKTDMLGHLHVFQLLINRCKYGHTVESDESELVVLYARHFLETFAAQLRDAHIWDGTISNFHGMSDLVCGLLGCLIGSNIVALAPTLQVLRPLLKQLVTIKYQHPQGQQDTNKTVCSLAEALLLLLDRISGVNTMEDVAEMITQHVIPTIPPWFQQSSFSTLSRQKAEALTRCLITDAISEWHSSANNTDLGKSASKIAVAAQIIASQPVYIDKMDDKAGFITIAESLNKVSKSALRDVLIGQISGIFNITLQRVWAIKSIEERTKRLKDMRIIAEKLKEETDSNLGGHSLALKMLGIIDHNAARANNLLDQNTTIRHALKDRLVSLTSAICSLTASWGDRRGNDQMTAFYEVQNLSDSDTIVDFNLSTEQGWPISNKQLSATLSGLKPERWTEPTHQNLLSVNGHQSEPQQVLAARKFIPSLGKYVILAQRIKSDSAWVWKNIEVVTSCVTLMKLCNQVSPTQICLHLELAALILTLRPECINQAVLDMHIAALDHLTSSRLRLEHPGNHQQLDASSSLTATGIYERIIGLVSILLTRYRRRLNGRIQLLLPLLLKLQRCLFYTSDQKYLYQNISTAKQKQVFRSGIPAWVVAGIERSLPPSSADKFSRILTSICNPTVASARSAQRSRRRKRTGDGSELGLNDETQKARKLAAQFMQHLVADFARSSLDGVITPEAKDKLLPGLHSILECMDKDMMSTLNASMDPSSRAMYKDLYADWTKFGKWNHS